MGELHRIHGRFNSAAYIDVLENVLVPTVRERTGLETFNYVQVATSSISLSEFELSIFSSNG